jgi:hypothetical protein
VRNLRRRLNSQPDQEPATLLLPEASMGRAVDVLVVIETPTASQLAALMAPVRFLDPARVAVLTTAGSSPMLQGDPSTTTMTVTDHHELARVIPRLRCVLTYGHYMRLGAMAETAARTTGATSFVSQHGILTPFAPPLPDGAQLLAWSADDAGYWTLGRPDVTSHIVGSQLLHEAGVHHRADNDAAQITNGITYLGQLHGYELPRRSMASAASNFCREHGAIYRPHPSESDFVSRLHHLMWRARGIQFDLSRRPLEQLRTSVVSVFSTGVLEAAASGIPAWVDHPDPPLWIKELWQRYQMQQYGSAEPTKIDVPPREPAMVIAELLDAHARSGQ